MQKLLAAIILGAGLVWSTAAAADPHYYVVQGDAVSADGYVEIRSEAFGRGSVKCKVPAGNYLHRNHEQNWSQWIFVQWKIPTPSDITNPSGSAHGHSADGRSDQEWKYIDADNSWCAIWDRRGWVSKSDPDLRVLEGHPNEDRGVLYPLNTWGGRLFVGSHGNWGWGIPVYRTPEEFLRARDAGWAIGEPVCKIRRHETINWTRPYRDWGVAEVHVKSRNCTGYTDRSLLER